MCTSTHVMLNTCFSFLIFVCLNIPEISRSHGDVFSSCESLLLLFVFLSPDTLFSNSDFLVSHVVIGMQ